MVENMKEIILPDIGELIRVERWRDLAEYFGNDRVAKLLTDHPDRYRPWVFDGCSGPPQAVFKALCGDRYELVTVYICLPHDIDHAAGGTEEDRARSNMEFRENLIDLAQFNAARAYAFYYSVVLGGSGKLDTLWKWGFAVR